MLVTSFTESNRKRGQSMKRFCNRSRLMMGLQPTGFGKSPGDERGAGSTAPVYNNASTSASNKSMCSFPVNAVNDVATEGREEEGV